MTHKIYSEMQTFLYTDVPEVYLERIERNKGRHCGTAKKFP